MRRTLIGVALSAMATLSCKDATGPDELLFVGETPSPTQLIAVTPTASGVTTLVTFNQVDVTILGKRSMELRFAASNGCTVELIVPFFAGIYAMDSSAAPSGPARGSVSCGVLGGNKDLRGEVVVLFSDVNHDTGIAQVLLMVGKLRWQGSGVQRFAYEANMVATQPPPPPPGGGGSIVCPSVPTGYSCVTVGGKSAPVKYSGLPSGPSGPYTNSGLGACINFNTSTGVSTITMSGGIGGGPTTYTGKWGALVNSAGTVVTGNGNVIYIFTGATDPQIALQNWAPGGFVQPGWTAGGC